MSKCWRELEQYLAVATCISRSVVSLQRFTVHIKSVQSRGFELRFNQNQLYIDSWYRRKKIYEYTLFLIAMIIMSNVLCTHTKKKRKGT